MTPPPLPAFHLLLLRCLSESPGGPRNAKLARVLEGIYDPDIASYIVENVVRQPQLTPFVKWSETITWRDGGNLSAVGMCAAQADQALAELDDALTMSIEMQDKLDMDPTSPEVLAADRLVAAAARRAVRLRYAVCCPLLTTCVMPGFQFQLPARG